jgi:hypothetical protein
MEQSKALSPSSALNLTPQAIKSLAILRCETSPQRALDAAERLIGQWPHAKPPNPKTYSAAIAAVLTGYPLGLVQQCCDPRTGLARHREFPPTVAAIVAWCDLRLAWHQAMATKRLPAPELPDNPAMRQRIKGLFDDLLGWWKNQRPELEEPIPQTTSPAPGGHMARVLADLELRKSSRSLAVGEGADA